MMTRAIAALALVAALAPGVASADDDGGEADPRPEAEDDLRPEVEVPASEVPDEPEPYLAEFRHPRRLVIGFDFGIGVFDLLCGGCQSVGALHLDFFAGVQVARRVALLAEGWSMLHLLPTDERDRNGLAVHTIATAGARVWLVPRLWVQAGAGAGAYTEDQGGDHYRLYGPAAVVAIGGEPGHKWCSGIDLSFRLGGTIVDIGDPVGRTLLYSIGAAAGFHWN